MYHSLIFENQGHLRSFFENQGPFKLHSTFQFAQVELYFYNSEDARAGTVATAKMIGAATAATSSSIARRVSSCSVDWAAGLPPELLKEIFSKTDVKTSLQCRRVCRHWDAAFLLYGPGSLFAVQSAIVTLEEREDLPETHGLPVTAVRVTVKSAEGVVDGSLRPLILFDNEQRFDRAAEQLTKLCGSSLKSLEIQLVLEPPLSSYKASDGTVKAKFTDRLIFTDC